MGSGTGEAGPDACQLTSTSVAFRGMKKALILCVFALAGVIPRHVFGCPLIEGIVDFNCDRKLSIAVIGDSLVSGIGDTKNGNRGGYVLRAARKFPEAEITGLGTPGLHTGPFIRTLNRAFQRAEGNKLATALLRADVVVLDFGRNDRWEFGLPAASLRNLKRISTIIRSHVEKAGNTPPFIITSVLMLPNRGSQGPWVKELNALILKSSRADAPADLRFDLVSKRLLASDQIHPTSKGYDALAATFVKYLKKPLPAKMLRQRPDSDNDGVFDLFETSRFGTDPSLLDSDGDGVSDGAELFTHSTDPLIAETVSVPAF